MGIVSIGSKQEIRRGMAERHGVPCGGSEFALPADTSAEPARLLRKYYPLTAGVEAEYLAWRKEQG